MNFNPTNIVNFSAYFENHSSILQTELLDKLDNTTRPIIKNGIERLNKLEGSDHIDVFVSADHKYHGPNIVIEVRNRDLALKAQTQGVKSLSPIEEINKTSLNVFSIKDMTKTETWDYILEKVIAIRDQTHNNTI